MQRTVTLIFGKTGSGKTTLARKFIQRHERVVVFDLLQEYHEGTILDSLESFIRYFSKRREVFTVSCRFETMLEYKYAAEALWILENCLLVLEECSLYLTSAKESDTYSSLILQGRHAGISLLGITQRPKGVSINFRSMITSAYSFRMDEPDEISYLSQWGFDPEELRSLPQFQFATIGEENDRNFEKEKEKDIPT